MLTLLILIAIFHQGGGNRRTCARETYPRHSVESDRHGLVLDKYGIHLS